MTRLLLIFTTLVCVLPSLVEAQAIRGQAGTVNARVRVFHNYDLGPRIWSFRGLGASIPQSPCFPFSCGGIGKTARNPDPDARKPENLTSCIYDSKGLLIYERENKTCSYEFKADAYVTRVERRRQEWLQSKK